MARPDPTLSKESSDALTGFIDAVARFVAYVGLGALLVAVSLLVYTAAAAPTGTDQVLQQAESNIELFGKLADSAHTDQSPGGWRAIHDTHRSKNAGGGRQGRQHVESCLYGDAGNDQCRHGSVLLGSGVEGFEWRPDVVTATRDPVGSGAGRSHGTAAR